MIGRLARWIDDRLGAAHFGRSTLGKVFPDHWSFLLGEVALYSFIVVVMTGVFLAFFYRPSLEEVIYQGSYAPLSGVQMSEAYESVLRLSFDVQGGLLMRQMHRWGVLVFIAAIVAHLARVYFTGAYRRPREVNWMIGVTMLMLAMVTAYNGYALPYDLLSGVGLRVGYSLVLSIPFAGPHLVTLFFGGEFPDPHMLSRFFFFHVLVLPGMLAALLGLHLSILWRQHHSQFPGPMRTERNVVGSKMWPTYAMKSLGLFLMVFAVIAALGALVQVNPIWLYGPFEPWFLTTPAQPDWYLGWIEGALRLFPAWEPVLFGYRIPNPFFPAVLLPALTFAMLYAWPLIDAKLTGDRERHQLLDRPRHRPVRTALGVAVLSFYGVLLASGSNDMYARLLDIPVMQVTIALRGLLLVVPVVMFVLTHRICKGLQAAEAVSPDAIPEHLGSQERR